MHFGLRWRIALTAVVVFIGVIFVVPTFVNMQDSPLRHILPDRVISLGLDLRGGIHLTLEVDVQTALRNSLSQIGEDIREEARDEKILLLRPSVQADGTLQVLLPKDDQLDAFQDLLRRRFPVILVDEITRQEQGRIFTLSYTDAYAQSLKNLAVDQAVKTIRNRIDQFGVSEPDIRKQQDNRIQVQLPGISDTQRAVRLVGQTAHLEFKLVDETADPQQAVGGIVPPGSEAVPYSGDAGTTERMIVVKKDVQLTGEAITDARVSYDNFGTPYVSFSLNARGARVFERVTGENIGKRLAIILDGRVHSAPVIQGKIPGGKGQITGQFTDQEAHDLAIVLRAGALPAPIKILEERAVGPSLGQESIDKGVMSAIIGGVLILLFMAVYYGMSGIVADIALGLNILLIMAGLAGFGATLTLPGIAGIILTIGMAVDANVLIFERIREELRSGQSPKTAIDLGFGRATLTILDANITTLIAAAILYQFGTGPIRGFAVTLSLGILASMFTAIFVSRIFFEYWIQKRKPSAALSI